MTRDQAQMLISGRDWKTPTFFRLFMPYLYQRVEVVGRKHAFLPLNRDYVPLGLRCGDVDVKYDQIATTHGVYFNRDPGLLEGVWWTRDGEQGAAASHRLWLYDDSTNSRMDYFARLERLLSRQMEMVA